MSQEMSIYFKKAMRRDEVDTRVHQPIPVGLGFLPRTRFCSELLISTFPDVLRDGSYRMFVVDIVAKPRRVDHSHPQNGIRSLVVALDLPTHIHVRRRPSNFPLFLRWRVPLPRIKEHVARCRLP